LSNISGWFLPRTFHLSLSHLLTLPCYLSLSIYLSIYLSPSLPLSIYLFIILPPYLSLSFPPSLSNTHTQLHISKAFFSFSWIFLISGTWFFKWCNQIFYFLPFFMLKANFEGQGGPGRVWEGELWRISAYLRGCPSTFGK